MVFIGPLKTRDPNTLLVCILEEQNIQEHG
jgi:hypothetical protein